MLTPTTLTISGCKVKFPAKAYPSQVAMMAKIINSLHRRQNSLLESPTGSGKSLALLCASLAWQEGEEERVREFNTLLDQATHTQDPGLRDLLMAKAGPDVEMEEEYSFPTGTADCLDGDNASHGGFIHADPDEVDFVEPDAKRTKHLPAEESVAFHLPPGNLNQGVGPPKMLRMPKRRKVPKIYFGTRTHKQVTQIVRELGKTSYKGVRMTILGSREHTCVHPTISKSYNKNIDCQELMDKKKGGGCRFHQNVKAKLSSHSSLRAHLGHENAWDLEDIVKVGKRIKTCPYYAVRELRNAAQLIICPYNYLVDPKIRKSMEISLKDQIVVIDEAHNIEDSARDAVSGSFNLDDIGITLQECEKMVSAQVLPATHSALADFCSRLASWMQKCADDARPDYSDWNSSARVWQGSRAIAEWNEQVFAPSNYSTIKSQVADVIKEQATASEEQETGVEAVPILSRKASEVLDGLVMLLDYMYVRESRYIDDYRMAVVKSQTRKKTGAGAGGKNWLTKGGDKGSMVNVINLHFWCLNPAVCFNDLKDECRSVVLTSGTLSPIVTFASELDAKFPITLEADHVIDRRQVWVGTLGRGPTGQSLNATYRNTGTLEFQDEMGRLVAGICHKVPHGILLFLPSYKMLDTLTNRWQVTGAWADIMARKTIVSEPRFSDQLDSVMKEFYEAVVVNDGTGESGQDGALFLAVCRGKVSEGLDFADNNARAVICVGIPFPNVKDSLVDLKRKYNDNKRATRDPNILSGGEWYEIQAFRALNQALGRCIRHRKDWGAILMVDDRYQRNEKYVSSLSKWVRKQVVHYRDNRDMVDSLTNFIQTMKSMEAEELSSCSQAVSATDDASPSSSSTTTDSDSVKTKPVQQNLMDDPFNRAEAASGSTSCMTSETPTSGSKDIEVIELDGPLPAGDIRSTEDDEVAILSSTSSAWTTKETIAAKAARLKFQGFKRKAQASAFATSHSTSNLDSKTHLDTAQNLNTSKNLNGGSARSLPGLDKAACAGGVGVKRKLSNSPPQLPLPSCDVDGGPSLKADSGSSLRSADFEPSPLQTPRLSPPSVQEDLSLLQQLPDLKSKKENLGAALFDDKGVSECEILEACKDPKEKAEETIAIIDFVGVVVGDKSSKISPPSSSKVGEVKEDCNEVGPSSSKEQLEDDADSVDVIDMSDNELSAAAANSMPNNSTDAFESASPKMSNRFWAAQFKERRERRLAQIEKQKVNKQQLVTQTAAAATSVAASAADVTIVPDTPEKKADQDDDLDWGDDCFPSVEDVDGHKVLRTPLRESNNGTADTANKSDNLEEVKSPEPENLSFGFSNGKSGSGRLKKKVKRRSLAVQNKKVPLYNSDDDFA